MLTRQPLPSLSSKAKLTISAQTMIKKFLRRLPTSSRMQVRSYNAAPEYCPSSSDRYQESQRDVPPDQIRQIGLTRPVASPTVNNREPVQPRTRRAVFIVAPGDRDPRPGR